MFLLLLYVAWKRGLPRKCARFVLFRPIKKRSFNLLCVLGPFFSIYFVTEFLPLSIFSVSLCFFGRLFVLFSSGKHTLLKLPTVNAILSQLVLLIILTITIDFITLYLFARSMYSHVVAKSTRKKKMLSTRMVVVFTAGHFSSPLSVSLCRSEKRKSIKSTRARARTHTHTHTYTFTHTYTPSTKQSQSGLVMLSKHSVETYQGNELTCNSSGNARPQWS